MAISLSVIDYGFKFENELMNEDLTPEQIIILKGNCFTYLKQVLKEMLNRLPEKRFKVYKKFSITK